MDSTDFPMSRSPRKELQGPRPPALKVRKDSHKIKKPPVAPPPAQPQASQTNYPNQQPIYQQPRQPVIIYTVSPKVIHTDPRDFMSLVQRLTGPSPTSSSASASTNLFNEDVGAISPSARYATIEKAARSPKEKNTMLDMSGDVGSLGGLEMMGQVMEKSRLFTHGILSPGPALLPPIPPNFFSPLSDPNLVSFFQDLSPVLHGNRNFMDGSFIPSPSTFISPRIASPFTPSIDLFNNFNNFFDL